MAMRTSGVKLDFEKLIAKGENPNGFTAQTANGTAHWKVEPGPTRPAGRSNRTAE